MTKQARKPLTQIVMLGAALAVVLWTAEVSSRAAEDGETPPVPAAAGTEQTAAGTDAATTPEPEDESGPAPVVEDAPLSGGEALLEKFKAGGKTMLLLLALSVIMGAVGVERLFCLRIEGIVPSQLAEQARPLWEKGDFEELKNICAANPSIYSDIVAYLVDRRNDPPQLLAEEVEELGRHELAMHFQKLRPLTVVATLSPLVGLFGTVLGMIESFDTVALMGELGDASMLAAGISKALVTTAGGLIIAIPAIAIYHFFRSRTEQYGRVLEQATLNLIRRCVRLRIDKSEEDGGDSTPSGQEVVHA